jgi:hypothetical protein
MTVEDLEQSWRPFHLRDHNRSTSRKSARTKRHNLEDVKHSLHRGISTMYLMLHQSEVG